MDANPTFHSQLAGSVSKGCYSREDGIRWGEWLEANISNKIEPRICTAMRLRKHLLLLSLASVVIAGLPAQTPDEPDWQKAAGGTMAFDVASVKLAKVPGLNAWLRFLYGGDAKPPGGRFSATASLSLYIFFAYKLAPFEAMDMFVHLPKWAYDNFAIDAKAEGNPTKDQMRLMMQSLLADRFMLRAHFETKEVPVLALTLVNPSKLGPKLLPHSEGPPCPDSFEMDKPFTRTTATNTGARRGA